MAIQHRRGNYGDFDKSKMVAGEFAVVLQDDPNASDGKAVYMAFSSGSAKQLMTVEDAQDELEAAVAEATAEAEQAAERAEAAGPLSDDIKTALLSCFAHVAWIDEHGQDYYDALESALYGNDYPRIVATFTPGTHVVYTDDSLSTLTPYLTVTYFEDAGDSGTPVSSSEYILSGMLTEGQSVIRVEYGNLSTIFVLNVVDYYNIYTWDFASDATALYMESSPHAATGVQISSGVYRPSIDNETTNVTRNTFIVTKGKAGSHVVKENGQETSYYLIPMPEDATSVSATVTPNTQYLSIRTWIYNGDGNWTREGETGWKQGTATLTREAAANRYIHMNFKAASDGTIAYNTTTYPRPSNIHIEFSNGE